MAESAQAMFDHIATSMGGPLERTGDGVIVGDASQPVRGVVTTFMASIPVIRRTAELGANVLIAHEPMFYNVLDDVTFLQHDRVYQAKLRLLEESGIVVVRLHDYPHGFAKTWDGGTYHLVNDALPPGDPKEDPFLVGLLDTVGWSQYADAEVPYFCTIPTVSLRDLIGHLKHRLNLSSVRMLGDLDQQCTRVVLFLGGLGVASFVPALARFDADVVVTGECLEWETFSYAADAHDLGIRRSIVAIGHQPSEEPGMERIAVWLREEFPGIEVTHVPSAHCVDTA